jgi:nucleoside-diphosphate-sugar epimerase
MPSRNKIILTGATGYVGGTILDHLIKDTSQSLKEVAIDVLVRKEDQAEKLREVYGGRIGTILWKGLTDEDFIINTAANCDIVINAGSGFFPAGAVAFVEGLARRVKNGKRAPWMIHIAGCTNLSDLPIRQGLSGQRMG